MKSYAFRAKTTLIPERSSLTHQNSEVVHKNFTAPCGRRYPQLRRDGNSPIAQDVLTTFKKSVREVLRFGKQRFLGICYVFINNFWKFYPEI